MRKNKKESIFPMLSTTLMFGVLIVAFCLLYIWQQHQAVKIGYRITMIKKQMEELDEIINRLDSKIQTLKSPEKILERISGDLKMTESDKIIHLARVPHYLIQDNTCVEVPAYQVRKSFVNRLIETALFWRDETIVCSNHENRGVHK